LAAIGAARLRFTLAMKSPSPETPGKTIFLTADFDGFSEHPGLIANAATDPRSDSISRRHDRQSSSAL
jgi:hypothetical protein